MNEIVRTHSAPPQLNPQESNNVRTVNVGQSGHPSNVGVRQPTNIHQQQTIVSHPQTSVPVNNSSLHRKDSVSSNVSSNDGQQPYHPHQPSLHHHNHSYTNQQHGHPHYRQHPHHKPGIPPGQYSRARENKHIPPSPHLNAQQPVQTQGAIPIGGPASMPMTVPQQMWSYNAPRVNVNEFMYYQTAYPPHLYMHQYTVPRPVQQSTHISQQVNTTNYVATPQSKAIPIVDPTTKLQQQLSKSPNLKKDEVFPAVIDKKPEETDKERLSSEDKDKATSRAIRIVNPAEKERKEREEFEKKDREEQERLAREKEEIEREEKARKEAEEKARKEQEEKERQEAERRKKEEEERLAREKEEKERKEAEERARKEQEERERQEAERKKKEEEERLAREKEERERKEAEERFRKEQEEKARQEAERKKKEEEERLAREEKERKEAEERARKEQEEKARQEAERQRKEEERLAREKEEKERKEAEEKARKEQEERERQESERKKKEEERLAREKEEKERKEAEEKERRESEARARKEQEEKERQEADSKKKEKDEVVIKAEEGEKKKEAESSDKKDSKKEEKKFGKGNRPGPLDLSLTTSAPAIPSAPLSALGSARAIDDLSSVAYPPHIKSPDPKLNVDADPGKYKYDRLFLMQFMDVCKEKPEHLPALEAIGMEEPKDDKKNRQGPRPQNSRMGQHKSSPNQTQFSQMGEFKYPPLKTSEERFRAASMRIETSTSGSFGRNSFARTGSGSTLLPPPTMSATVSPPSPGRTSSGRRDGTRRSGKGAHQMQGQNIGQEHIAPLERSENRWVADSVLGTLPKVTEDVIPMEIVQRKVKALLNKLTLEKFDSISDQIIDYANKSRDERDGRILKEVIRLIFEKSCDEPNFCAMYAQLCRKMMERIDPEIVDENVKNVEGKFVQGGTLFRKYLLNRCQEDFEKGWKVNIPVPANEKGEPDLMSDEYYVAAKAKRHGLGLIRFIGELFKLNMLTERIMHECIKKLLSCQDSPEEEEMESLCKLMNTVGEQLDHANGRTNQFESARTNQLDDVKARQYMDNYFNRMENITKNPNLSSRIKFMIMDVIDLRSNSWKPRRDINAPKTIAEIHEDAAKQKEEAEYIRRTTSSGGRGMPKMAEQMSRSSSGRREKGNTHGSSAPGNDGWISVGGNSSQRSNKVGDLTKFGSIRNSSKITSNVSLAPGGSLGNFKGWNKGENKDREDKSTILSRTNSTSNMYSVLEGSEGRKSSEFSASEAQKPAPPTERKKLALLPRSIGISSEESQATTKSVASKSNSEVASSVQTMSEEMAGRKIDSTVEEYFSVLDIEEVLTCLKEIPAEYHAKAVEAFVNKVIEKKQADVDHVIKLFKEIISSETCDNSAFNTGFTASLDFLMDIGADAPMAYAFTGQLLYSTGLDFRDITTLLKPLQDERGIEKILKGYTGALKNDVGEQKYVQKMSDFDFKSLFKKNDINKFLEDLELGHLKK